MVKLLVQKPTDDKKQQEESHEYEKQYKMRMRILEEKEKRFELQIKNLDEKISTKEYVISTLLNDSKHAQ